MKAKKRLWLSCQKSKMKRFNLSDSWYKHAAQNEEVWEIENPGVEPWEIGSFHNGFIQNSYRELNMSFSELLRCGNVEETKKFMSTLTNGYQVFNPFSDPIQIDEGSTTDSKLKAMQFTKSMFDGKSVLDLGCNLGVFSFIALNFGAKKVTAYESEQHFYTTAMEIMREYENRFPHYRERLKFVLQNLRSLPPLEKSDVIMANSIIHWFFTGENPVTMEQVAKWFHDHCNEAVYFEGCISAAEPVMKTFKVDINNLNEKLFYDEMSKYFHINFVGRPSYNSSRVVLRMLKK